MIATPANRQPIPTQDHHHHCHHHHMVSSSHDTLRQLCHTAKADPPRDDHPTTGASPDWIRPSRQCNHLTTSPPSLKTAAGCIFSRSSAPHGQRRSGRRPVLPELVARQLTVSCVAETCQYIPDRKYDACPSCELPLLFSSHLSC